MFFSRQCCQRMGDRVTENDSLKCIVFLACYLFVQSLSSLRFINSETFLWIFFFFFLKAKIFFFVVIDQTSLSQMSRWKLSLRSKFLLSLYVWGAKIHFSEMLSDEWMNGLKLSHHRHQIQFKSGWRWHL